jgi:TonB family protein
MPELEPPPEAPPEPEPKQGVSMQKALPSVLTAWGRLVQRQVERRWRVPAGVFIDPDNNDVIIAFWVNREGRLLGEPKIIKEASDPVIAKSAVQAIKAAQPFANLPDAFRAPEVEIVYTFVPKR